jgi:hypothetical protein
LIIDKNSLAFHLGIRRRTLEFLLLLRNSGPQGTKNYRHGKSLPDGTVVDEPFLYAYKCFTINKIRDGVVVKARPIQEPMPLLKNVHRVVNSLLSNLPYPKPVIAYVKGLSIADAVEQHVRASYWLPKVLVEDRDKAKFIELEADPRYKKVSRLKESHVPTSEDGWFFFQPFVEVHLDIANFFNSVRASWIRKFFEEDVGYSHAVSYAFAQLCTVKWDERRRFLPQGSPLSGSMANMVAYQRFGRAVEEFLKTQSPDWIFTIYSDDISMTHPDLTVTQEQIDLVVKTVIGLVEEAGFKINAGKTRVTRSKNAKVKMLGCVINEKLNVEKSTFNRVKRTLCACIDNGWSSVANGQDLKLRQYLVGKMQSIRQIRQDRYEILNALYLEALKAHPITPRKVPDVEISAASGSPQAELPAPG